MEPPRPTAKHNNRKSLGAFLNLCRTLSEDSRFMELVLAHTSSSELDSYVYTRAQESSYPLVKKHNAFRLIYRRLASSELPSNSSPSIQEMLSVFRTYTNKSSREGKTRHNLSHRIGFAFPTVSRNLKVIHLTKRLSIYPPLKHIVYEGTRPNPYPKGEPTCGYTSLYCKLDPNQLSYDLSPDESAIFYDPNEKKIIAVVIRDLAQSSFKFIKKWGVNLIRNDMPKRRKEQRNGPGELAMFGASPGARSKGKIGWVANLLSKVYERSSERDTNDSSLSSLFALFFNLASRQLPTDIINDILRAMESSKLPFLDYDGKGEFTIPLEPEPISFSVHSLSPPGGFIAIDYFKYIHKDSHWPGCPWGLYWNLLREQNDYRVEVEMGANFFIADYGLRITNSENVCVAWDVSLWHGTSWYYDGLSQVGLAMVLTHRLDKAWAKFLQKNGIRDYKFKQGEIVTDSEYDSDS